MNKLGILYMDTLEVLENKWALSKAVSEYNEDVISTWLNKEGNTKEVFKI